MKEVIDGKNPVTGEELVPVQDFIDFTIEGIPQEVIDELYETFKDVDYTSFKKRVKERLKVYASSYVREIEEGEYKFQDQYWKEQYVTGKLLERCSVTGFLDDAGTFHLTAALGYNTIKETKR